MQTTDKSELDLLNRLENLGFTHHMIFNKGKIFVDKVDSCHAFGPDEIKIHDTYRFEGASNPDDMSIVYAIETEDGLKGSIVIAYGPNGNLEAAEFFKKVEEGITS